MVIAAERLLCPKCGWSDVRSSDQAGFLDRAAALLFLSPLRCRKCRLRFYRPWFIARRVRSVMLTQRPIPVSGEITIPISAPVVPHRILLLDDDPALRKLLRRLLCREGYEVREASNTRDGLEELDAGGIDLVIVNLSAHEAGEMAVQLLTCAYDELIIITLTEKVSLADRSENLLILLKPSRAVSIVQKVGEMISRHRQAGSESAAQENGQDGAIAQPF